MRTGRDGKLKVKVAREGGLQVSRSKDSLMERSAKAGSSAALQPQTEQVLSDEEMAWRLHQELNATSPMLRTRSRKAPEFLAAGQPQKSAGGGASSSDPQQQQQQQQQRAQQQGQASGSEENAGPKARSKGEGKPTRSVNKGSQLRGERAQEANGADSEERPNAAAAAAGQPAGGAWEHEAAAGQDLPGGAVKSEGEAAVDAGAGAAAAEQQALHVEPPALKVEAEDSAGEELAVAASPQHAGAAASPRHTRHVEGSKRARRSPFEGGASAGAGREGHAPVRPASSSPAEPPAAPMAVCDKLAAKASGPSSAAGNRASPSEHQDDSSSVPAEVVAAQQILQQARDEGGEEAAAQPPPRAKKGRGGRQPKIPKLPMVRQEDGRWYRARLLKDAGDKVSLEFTGFESQFPPIWLPRDSDRIWRGSYKGKDWKHLGGGAWAPKVKNGGRRNRGGKRKRAEKKSSEDGAHSSGGVGPSQSMEEDSQEQSEDEGDFDEAESGHPRKPGVKAEPDTQWAGEAGGTAPKQEAREDEGSGGSAAIGQEGPAGEEPARKKGKRNNSRKRLDPIVREALIAAEQGVPTVDDSSDQAGPSHHAEGQSTPYGWKGAWKRHHRAAAAAATQQAAAEEERGSEGEEGAAAQPHLTPTPETPVTRLGKRMSLTPGTYAPLSPRAAAAAAAAIEDAAGAPHQRQEREPDRQREREPEGGAAAAELELPLNSPRGPRSHHRLHGGTAWASAAAAVLAASPRAGTGTVADGGRGGDEPPLSPRQRQRSGGGEGPGSPRHRMAKAAAATAAAAIAEEEGDSGDGQEGRAGRRARRQQHRVFEESDSEAAAEGTGSESQEEALPKARPRRRARKAAIYKDEDFAVGDEAEEDQAAAAAAAALAAAEAEASQDAAAANQAASVPARRRRKPLVACPAPTDVGVVASGNSRGSSALPAPLAALDVLPPPPPPPPAETEPAVAVAAELCGPEPASVEAAAAATATPALLGDAAAATVMEEEGIVDPEEAAAVAALADMPSPRAASAAQRAQQAQQQLNHYRQQQQQMQSVEEDEGEAMEEEEAELGGDDDGDADYAPPVRRPREPPLPGAELPPVAFKKRSTSGTLPMNLDHVRTGRVHKLHGQPLSRHYSLTYADRQYSTNGRRPLPHPGKERFARSGSAAASDEGPAFQGHGGGRRGGFERNGSLGLPPGVDGLAAAQGMFGPLLSALKRAGLDDSGRGMNGVNGSRKGGKGLLAGLELGGGNGRPSLHLFSTAWSYSKWHSHGNGEQHPSILSIQPDLFSKACAANGASAAAHLFSLGGITGAASTLPSSLMHCAAAKPPLPLFC